MHVFLALLIFAIFVSGYDNITIQYSLNIRSAELLTM